MSTLLYIDGYESSIPNCDAENQVFYITDDVATLYASEANQNIKQISTIEEINGITNILIHLNSGSTVRSQRKGIQWLKRFRVSMYQINRVDLASLPALLYSFEDEYLLQDTFPILTQPGHTFCQLPTSLLELKEKLVNISKVPDSILSDLLCFHCLDDVWGRLEHDLTNTLSDPKYFNVAKKILKEWGRLIVSICPNITSVFKELTDAFNGLGHTYNSNKVQHAFFMIDKISGILRGESEDELLVDAPYEYPPLDWERILVADDRGYEISTIQRLTRKGYRIEVKTNIDDSVEYLRNNKCDVILCDLHFPTRSDGEFMIKIAKEKCKVVIVISRAPLPSDLRLPANVLNACGSLRFQDSERIHQLIWSSAKLKGIISPAFVSNRLKQNMLYDSTLLLKYEIFSRVKHWESLPKAIVDAVSSMSDLVSSGVLSTEDTKIVNGFIDEMKRNYICTELTFAHINGLVKYLSKSNIKTQNRQINDILHNTIKQHIGIANAGIKDLYNRLTLLKLQLKDVILKKKYEKLDVAIRACKNTRISYKGIHNLYEIISEIIDFLPVEINASEFINNTSKTRNYGKKIVIASIEDNLLWHEQIANAINIIGKRIGLPYLISLKLYKDVESALNDATGIPSLLKDNIFVIFILDMNIPLYQGQKISDINNEAGFGLLKWAKDIKRNLPVIVLSQPSYIIDDQIRALNCGIDYFIYKVPGNLFNLVKAIENIIYQSSFGRISFLANNNKEILADDVLIKLTKKEYDVIYTLCWITNEKRTVEELSGNRPNKPFKIHATDFNLMPYSDIDVNIQNIRVKIFNTFKKIGKSVNPDDFLFKENNLYIVKAESIFPEDREIIPETYLDSNNNRMKKISSKYKILVVENDPVYLDYIEELLKRLYLVVYTATNKSDAVTILENNKIDIISLDLHIPANQNEYLSNHSAGNIQNGIDVLNIARGLHPTIRAIIPTTVSETKILQEESIRLHVRLEDIVPKGYTLNAIPWIAHYLNTISRFMCELQNGMMLYADTRKNSLLIEVLQGSEIGSGKLYLYVNDRDSKWQRNKKSQIMYLLLNNAKYNPGGILTLGVVKLKIWSGGVTDGAIQSQISDIRKTIGSTWNLSGVSPENVVESIHDNTPSRKLLGIKLNAVILDPDNLI